MRLLRKGDRIRLKVPTIAGWRGKATVTLDQCKPDDLVVFAKDGDDPEDPMKNRCCACRHEVALLRNQTTGGATAAIDAEINE